MVYHTQRVRSGISYGYAFLFNCAKPPQYFSAAFFGGDADTNSVQRCVMMSVSLAEIRQAEDLGIHEIKAKQRAHLGKIHGPAKGEPWPDRRKAAQLWA